MAPHFWDPSVNSFKPDEPQWPISSPIQGGMNSNDACNMLSQCLAHSRYSLTAAMNWHSWERNPNNSVPCFLLYTRHCVGQ